MASDNPIYQLKLSAEAYDDLVNIQNYTFTNFGELGWIRYEKEILLGFETITQHPEVGHHRNDIPQSYRAWIIKEHVILYRIEDHLIYVTRVLHKRMNFRWVF